MTFIGYVIGMILAGLFYAFCSFIGISVYFRKLKKKQEQEIEDFKNMLKGDNNNVQSSGKSGIID